jgi:hypothetical protein
MVKTIRNILECRLEEAPTEVTGHNLLKWMFSLTTGGKEYNKCMGDSWNTSDVCKSPIQSAFYPDCGEYRVSSKAYHCHKILEKTRQDLIGVPETEFQKFTANSTIHPALLKHYTCMVKVRTNVESCVAVLNEKCKSSSFRSFKEIRLDMRVVQQLLEQDDSIKVIYYVRDPRALAMGRKNRKLMSRSAKGNVTKEAELLCKTMLNDYRVFRQIIAEHPNSVLLTRYEDVAKYPKFYLEKIYRWLGSEPIPSTLSQKWMMKFHAETENLDYNMSIYRKNSTEAAFAWRKLIKPYTLKSMNDICQDTLKVLGYPVP